MTTGVPAFRPDVLDSERPIDRLPGNPAHPPAAVKYHLPAFDPLPASKSPSVGNPARPPAWKHRVPQARIKSMIAVFRPMDLFCGIHPVFEHGEEDRASFRMFSAQLVCQGSCRPMKSSRRLGSRRQRQIKKYRDEGIESFFRRRRRSSNVLTPEVVARAQELLYRGGSPSEVADELEIKRDTLRSNQGRIQGPPRHRHPAAEAEARARWRPSRLGPLRTSRSAASMRRPRWGSPARGRWSGWPPPWDSPRPLCRDVSFGGVRPAGADPTGLTIWTSVFPRWPATPRRPSGSHGVVSADGRAIAIPVAWGTGQAAGAGPRARALPPPV